MDRGEKFKERIIKDKKNTVDCTDTKGGCAAPKYSNEAR